MEVAELNAIYTIDMVALLKSKGRVNDLVLTRMSRERERFRPDGGEGDSFLNIETERIGSNLIVAIDGELDLETSPTFRNTVEEALDHYQTIRHLILDLKKVQFIDSSGLGVILGRFKRLSQEGGRLSAVNVSGQVKRIFELSGLLKIMTIYPDRQQALDKF